MCVVQDLSDHPNWDLTEAKRCLMLWDEQAIALTGAELAGPCFRLSVKLKDIAKKARESTIKDTRTRGDTSLRMSA